MKTLKCTIRNVTLDDGTILWFNVKHKKWENHAGECYKIKGRTATLDAPYTKKVNKKEE